LRRSFGSRFGFGLPSDLFTDLLGYIGRNRTRVRLFFRDAILGQKVNDGLGLDLEFAGQLVDSYLIYVAHSPLKTSPIQNHESSRLPVEKLLFRFPMSRFLVIVSRL
jgi:hypothetical protein